MIIIFHSFYFIAKFLLKYYRRRIVLRDFLHNIKQCQELSKDEASALEKENKLESLAVLKFDPPVYLQRYCDVQELLLDVRWGSEMAKIVEFGCAELKLFTYLKRLLYVKEILHIDIDEELLKDSLFRIEPLTVDHLVQRSQPLLVRVLAGSVSDPDYRLRGADAVIAIELIEHLYPDTLEALPYNIFSYIRPKLVIFTTPNADFNVLFPDFTGMRHYDHKFEWTRAQFQDWCGNIIKRFPQYSVTFQGCGSGPAGTESLGFCSQMAVFTKDYDCMESEVPNECCNIAISNQIVAKPLSREMDNSFGICTYFSYSKVQEHLSASSLTVIGSLTTAIQDSTPSKIDTPNFYRLVHKIDYPYYPDHRTPVEIKIDEARYKIHQARIYRQRYYDEELERLQIPVYDLIYNSQGQFSTVPEMSKLLSDVGFKLEQCVCDGSEVPAVCVIQYLDMTSSGRTSVSDLSDPPAADEQPSNYPTISSTQKQHMPREQTEDEEEEDWDNDITVCRTKLDAQDESNVPLTARLHLGAITATITNTVESNPSPGHNSDQLIDSGYQKSITSTAEWSPQSPLQDGMFEEQFNSCGGRSPVDSITEEDQVVVQDDKSPSAQKNTFTCALGSVVGKDGVGVLCTTLPGTSATNGKKMKKDAKDTPGARKKSRSKVHDLAEEDVRDLTQCLILNSLNRIPLEEPQSPDRHQIAIPVFPNEDKPDFAGELPEEIPDDLVAIRPAVAPLGLPVLEPLEVDVIMVGPVGVVENGDLANNNRDLEGNNYPDVDMEEVRDHDDDVRRDLHELEDNLNENIENNVDGAIANHQDQVEMANHDQDVANRNDVQNMPELPQQNQQALIPALVELNEVQLDVAVQDVQVPEQQLRGIRLPPPAPPSSLSAIEMNPELLDSPDSSTQPRILHQRENSGGLSCGIPEPPELAEVHLASREALFNSDSQIVLSDHIPEVEHDYENADEEVDDHGQRPRNIVLVGVNNYDDGMEDPFPHWLLQLLGDDGDPHDEPHFYCQGDGIGVHPSIVEVDIEDDEQSTSSSSADTSSAEENAATALASNTDDMEQLISLPTSSAATLDDNLELLSAHNELEVVGLSIYPRLHLDQLSLPNPPPSSVATTPLDSISPRTSLTNIATTTTNLMTLNISGNTTDRDSGDEMFFDTTEDLPNAPDVAQHVEGQVGQNLRASSDAVLGGSFGCFDASSGSSSEATSRASYRYE